MAALCVSYHVLEFSRFSWIVFINSLYVADGRCVVPLSQTFFFQCQESSFWLKNWTPLNCFLLEPFIPHFWPWGVSVCSRHDSFHKQLWHLTARPILWCVSKRTRMLSSFKKGKWIVLFLFYLCFGAKLLPECSHLLIIFCLLIYYI